MTSVAPAARWNSRARGSRHAPTVAGPAMNTGALYRLAARSRLNEAGPRFPQAARPLAAQLLPSAQQPCPSRRPLGAPDSRPSTLDRNPQAGMQWGTAKLLPRCRMCGDLQRDGCRRRHTRAPSLGPTSPFSRGSKCVHGSGPWRMGPIPPPRYPTRGQQTLSQGGLTVDLPLALRGTPRAGSAALRSPAAADRPQWTALTRTPFISTPHPNARGR